MVSIPLSENLRWKNEMYSCDNNSVRTGLKSRNLGTSQMIYVSKWHLKHCDLKGGKDAKDNVVRQV